MPATLLGAPVTRAHYPEMLLEGLREIFGSEYPYWDSGILENFYTVKGSRKDRESHLQTAGTGFAFPASEGASPIYDSVQEVYKKTVFHIIYKLGLEFTRESIDDNLYWNIADMAGKQLARSMAYTRQVFAFSPFNDLTETIYSAGGTDYQLLETNHFMLTNPAGYSNTLSTPAGLSLAGLETILQQWINGMFDQRGFKYMFDPSILHVSAKDKILAGRLLDSEKRPGGNMNDNNIVRSDWNMNRVVNPHLAVDGRWFVHAKKSDTMARFYDRVKANVDPYDGGDTGNRKFAAYMRISKAIPVPLGIAGSAGS
jgi:hypothetical protein